MRPPSADLDGNQRAKVRLPLNVASYKIFPSTLVGLPLPLLLPLAAAMVFVVGALLLKRASDLGADVWRTTRIINYTTAIVASPLFLLGGTIPSASLWWQPAVAGSLFFAGQVFSLLALSTGDVSVATPVLGVKILLVALLTAMLIGDPIGARLWTAAALSTVAIALLNTGGAHPHTRVGTTILLAALGATAYACFDVIVQKWSPVWGTGRIVPMAMACAAVYSIPLRRFSRSADLQVGREPMSRYTGWIIAGAVLFAVQGLTFITSISIYRHATTANVLYSSRGLWSVVAVWGIGHWFVNREQHLGTHVLAWRLVGAILLMAALLMVLAT
jgi:drug/metabolite transporter (DMT)-like permease